MRTSPVHYINPNSISITPNANDSANDLAVYVAEGTEIKVYAPEIDGLGMNLDTNTFRKWKLKGRNRSLRGGSGPYTIYARLPKTEVYETGEGYIVFATRYQYGKDNAHGLAGQWFDKYSYVTRKGLASQYDKRGFPAVVNDPNYWWICLGEVSEAKDGRRTVTLDTGILGTDQYNMEWDLDPDALPLRVELSCEVNGEDGGSAPFVGWEQTAVLTAKIVEGWETDASAQVDHWTVSRRIANKDVDIDTEEEDIWPGKTRKDVFATTGRLPLSHSRAEIDDFQAGVSAVLTVTAWGVEKTEDTDEEGITEETTDEGGEEKEIAYTPLGRASITIYAETSDKYEIEPSQTVVAYNPQTGAYQPATDISVRIKARAQDGTESYLLQERIDNEKLSVYCLPTEGDTADKKVLDVKDGVYTLPLNEFEQGRSIVLWLENGAGVELARNTVTYVRYGEKGDTPVNIYRWYKEGLEPKRPTDTSSDEPSPATGDATGAANVYPTGRWSKTTPDRPKAGDWLLYMCSSIKHGSGIIDPWQGPVRISGADGDAGADGSDREYIYRCLSTYPYSGKLPADETTGTVNGKSTPYDATVSDWVPKDWSDNAMEATGKERYVYIAIREKAAGKDQEWGPFSSPVLWSSWGVQGMDGDGVQYIYKLFDHELSDDECTSNIPDRPANQKTNGEWIPEGTGKNADWYDDPLSPTQTLPYCYCSVIKRIGGEWGSFGKLGLWSRWSKDGTSITKTGETYFYLNSNDGTTVPTGTWRNTRQKAINDYNAANNISGSEWQPGTWIWTQTTISWSDGSKTRLYSNERNPNDGKAGQDIVVDGATIVKYAVTTTNVEHPDEGSAEWKDITEVTQTQGCWLWSQATTWYRKSLSSENAHDAGKSVNYTVNYIAENGAPGRSVNSITEYYKATETSDALPVPTSSSGWSTDPNLSDLKNKWGQKYKYLWNYEEIAYSSGTAIERTRPAIVAIWTRDGADLEENLIDGSEFKNTFDVTSASMDSQGRRFYYPPLRYDIEKMPADGTVISGQARITLTDCTFVEGETPNILVYTTALDGKTGVAWPSIVYVNKDIEGNSIIEARNEGFILKSNGGQWNGIVSFRLNHFMSGTVTIERVKLEVGERCSAWSLSENDKKGTSVIYDVEHSSIRYAVSSLGTPEDGRDYPSDIKEADWQAAMPEPQKGKYLWTRDITAYNNGGELVYTTTYGVSYWGTDGENVEIDAVRTFVRYSTENSASQPADSTFTLTTPPTLSQGDYLWILSQTAYVGVDTALKSYSVSRVGDDGDKGDPGADGYTTHFAYAQLKDGHEIPASGKLTTAMVSKFSTVNFSGADAIGTYRQKNEKDGSTDADSTNIADYTWTEWRGDDGTGIDSIVNYYAISDSPSVAPEDDAWDDTPMAPTKDKPYLWNYEVITWTDKTSKPTYPCVIGHYGRDGADGKNAIRLDIDNEMDAVQTNSSGVVATGRSVSTIVRLYDGTEEVDISTATVSVSGGPASSIATYTAAAEPNNGKGRKLAWTFAAGKTIADTYDITISYTYRGATYKASFTIAASKGQAVYQLVPSQSSLSCTRNADNSLNAPAPLSLKILKIDGSGTAEKDATPDSLATLGLVVRYSTTGMPSTATGGLNWADKNNLLQATTTDTSVYFALFNDSGVVLDRETVPIVKDGAKGADGSGANAVRIDLSNEMDAIPCDADGYTLSEVKLTTQARIYDGSTPVTSGVTVAVVGDVAGIKPDDITVENGTVTVNWVLPAKTQFTADKYAADIELKLNDYISFFATFTAAVVKSGEPGVSPTIHQLNPSRTSINFNADEQTASTTRPLTCGYKRITGSSISIGTAGASFTYGGKTYRILYRYDGTGDWEYNSTSGITIPGNTEHTSVEFVLTTATSKTSITNANTIDRETVPIVKDGTSLTKNGETYRYATNQTGVRPAATSADWKTDKPELQQGWWLFTETTISWSDGTSTVLYSEYRDPRDGKAGQDIVIDGTTVMEYACTDSNTTHPDEDSTEWKSIGDVGQKEGWWLWAKATTWYRKAGSDDNAHDAGKSVNYTVSRIAKDGNPGRAVVTVVEFYKASTKDGSTGQQESAPDDDTGWSTDPNLTSKWGATYKYLWNYERVEYSSGQQFERTKPAIIAIWTKDGDNGRGIDHIDNFYAINDSPTEEPKSGWDETPMAPTADAPYLWNYERIYWTSGTPAYDDTYACVIGHYGRNGTSAQYIYLRGTGRNRHAERMVCISGTENLSGYQSLAHRGLEVVTIKRDTLEIDTKRWYDTYGGKSIYPYEDNDIKANSARTSLLEFLTGLDDSVFVAITSCDAIGWSDNLVNTLRKFGLGKMDYTATLGIGGQRTPFAFLGYKGLQEGYALWQLQGTGEDDPYAEVMVYVANGVFMSSRDGEDGTSPIVADLSNEMQSIACDADGKPVKSTVLTTTVSLWHGSALQSISSVKVNGVTLTASAQAIGLFSVSMTTVETYKRQLSFSVGTTSSIADVTSFSIEVSDDTNTRPLTFTVNGIRPGADGKPAIIYELLPSETEIQVGRTADGGYDPSTYTGLFCGYTKNDGGNITSTVDAYGASTVDGKYSIFFRLRNRTAKTWSSYTRLDYYTRRTVNSLDVSAYDRVEFVISDYSGTSSANLSGNKVIDRETVPVVADGTNGKDASAANPNLLLRTVFDNGLDFIKEKWDCGEWGAVVLDTAPNTQTIEGRQTIRITQENVSLTQSLLGKLKPDTWYTFSFYSFSDTGFIIYTYNYSSGTRTSIYADKKVIVDGKETTSDWDVSFPAAWDGARHTVTFKTNSNLSKTTLIIAVYMQAVEGRSDYNLVIGMPKLEVGQVATAYMPHEDDLRGADGTSGTDAVNVIISPASLIINQDTNNTSNIAYPNLSEQITVQVLQGTDHWCTINSITYNTGSRAYISGNTYKTISNLNTTAYTLTVNGIVKNGSSYYDNGTITLTIGYTDKAGNSRTLNNVKVKFYVNLLGTWSESVRNGVKTEIGQQVEATLNANNEAITHAYTAAIETSAKGWSQQMAERMARAGADGSNLFGFAKGVGFNCCTPFIQGYGIVCLPWQNSGDKTGRIYNLGMYGRLGYYTVTCQVRMSTSAGYVRLQMNWHEAVAGTTGIVYAYADSWTTLKATFLFDSTTETHVGATIEKGTAGSYSAGDINGYIDIGQIDNATDCNRIVVNDIFVRHLKVEYGNEASAWCEADEDMAYIGGGQLLSGYVGTDNTIPDVTTPDGTLIHDIRYAYYTSSGTYSKDGQDVTKDSDYWLEFAGWQQPTQFQAGKIYTFSFWARSTTGGIRMSTGFHLSSGSFPSTYENIYVPTAYGEIVETNTGTGGTNTILSTSWKHYYIRWYTQSVVNVTSMYAASIGWVNNKNISGTVYIGGMKLEEGYVMDSTEWTSKIEQTARRISLVQYTAGRMAGIDMQNGTVKLLADRVAFANSAGTVTDKIWIDPTAGTLHAVNGSFSGILSSNLLYLPTKWFTVTSSNPINYNIDPKNEPYNCYGVETNTVDGVVNLYLPSADSYDGLELKFIWMPLDYIGENKEPMRIWSGNNNIWFYRENDGEYINGYLCIPLSGEVRLKALQGRWVFLEGSNGYVYI